MCKAARASGVQGCARLGYGWRVDLEELARVRVVLVRSRYGGNVGSAARAMKNMGLSDLVLVAPRARVGAVGARMAAHAKDLLASRRTVTDLSSAVDDCTLVVGTTCREGGYRGALRPMREVAREVAKAARTHRVALVFGPEDHGLDNADLRLCQRLARIPTSAAYPSLNLAQAVLLSAYEVWLALLEADAREPRHGRRSPDKRAQLAGGRHAGGRHGGTGEDSLASSRERQELIAHLGEALDRIGFLSTQNPEHILHDVRSLFARAALTSRDVRVWRGIARQILWAASAAPPATARGVAQGEAARVTSRRRGPRATAPSAR